MENPFDEIKRLDDERQKLYREVEKNCIPLVDLRNEVVKEMGLNGSPADLDLYVPLWAYPDLDSYYGGIYHEFLEYSNVIVSGNVNDTKKSAIIPVELYVNPTREAIVEFYTKKAEKKKQRDEAARQKEKERLDARKRIFRGELSG